MTKLKTLINALKRENPDLLRRRSKSRTLTPDQGRGRVHPSPKASQSSKRSQVSPKASSTTSKSIGSGRECPVFHSTISFKKLIICAGSNFYMIHLQLLFLQSVVDSHSPIRACLAQVNQRRMLPLVMKGSECQRKNTQLMMNAWVLWRGVAITCTSLVVLALYVYIWSHVHGSSSIPMNWTFLIRSDIFPKQLRIQHLQTFLQRWPRRCWPAPTGWEEGEDWPGDETSRGWAVGLRVTRLLYTYIPFQRAKVFEVTVTSRPRSFQLPQTIEDNPWSLSRTNPFQFDLYQNHCDKQQKNQWSTFEKRESTSLILWRHKRSSL